MCKLTCKREGGSDLVIDAALHQNVLALLRENGVSLDAPCGGGGTCGKCRVLLLSGLLDAPSSPYLSDEAYASGWRLACQSRIVSDACIFIPAAAAAYQTDMRIADLSDARTRSAFDAQKSALAASGIRFCGSIRTIQLTLDMPGADDPEPDSERLCRAAATALHIKHISLDSAALRVLPSRLREHAFCVRCVVDMLGETPRILDVLPGDDNPVCGLAIDVGTTSVACVLADLESGDVLAMASAGNGQIRYGADVITRIIEQGKSGGCERLQRAIIIETLLPLLSAMYRRAGVQAENIYSAAIAGNTTMEHLLLGVPAEALRTEPYVPAFFALDPLPAALLALPMHPAAQVRLSPNIGSYVGGDITAGVLAASLWNTPELTLFIDLGTNGEIVLGNNEFLMACACSAGPAFEGGDISCGMRAASGAIDGVQIDSDDMFPTLSVIGGGAPVGICGSGIIACIAELFAAKIIDARGRLIRSGERIRQDEHGMRRYILAEGGDGQPEVSLTEVDIDNLIRAKGAIFSGIQTLLCSLSLTADDLSRVLVAGGIGSGVDMRAAIRIGMLPDIPLSRYAYAGNTSLAGAYAMLLSTDAQEKLFELARSMTYVELSAEAGYMDAFIAACFLPHTNAALFPSLEGVMI